jgi:hypothetical protein
MSDSNDPNDVLPSDCIHPLEVEEFETMATENKQFRHKVIEHLGPITADWSDMMLTGGLVATLLYAAALAADAVGINLAETRYSLENAFIAARADREHWLVGREGNSSELVTELESDHVTVWTAPPERGDDLPN